jgi:hypothetical protein
MRSRLRWESSHIKVEGMTSFDGIDFWALEHGVGKAQGMGMEQHG